MSQTNDLLEAMLDEAEEEGWYSRGYEQDGGKYIEFEIHSEAGEDFIMDIWYTDPEYLPVEIHKYAEDFDIEDHVHMWLDAKARGVGGVPGVVTLVDDARWIETAIESLSQSLLRVKLRNGSRTNGITKDQLRAYLRMGYAVSDVMELTWGQDCQIFKAKKFEPGDKILYIPDVSLNDIDCEAVIYDSKEQEAIIDNCYTGDDFIEQCGGRVDQAETLFYFVDWQHPSSAYEDLKAGGDFDEE